jgi:alcohol dehydrogenase class IV
VLGTPRALGSAPRLRDGAAAVHEMPPGRVDAAAASLRGRVGGGRLVAVGGGRTIDTAKAVAALEPGRIGVVAVPTTLSAAEMTSLHLQALGAPGSAPQVRPPVVLNDPGLCGSQPPADLAGSAANSLGHAVEAVLTPAANPVVTLAARRGAALLRAGLADPADPVALSLGALLCGYALDSAGFGLHHVMAQSVAAVAGVSHRQSNACLLPHTLAALRARGGRAEALAGFDVDLDALATELAERAGAGGLRDLGVAAGDLPACAELALERAELANTPPRPERAELLEIYRAAL